MNVVYIPYEKLHENPEKRILFLELLTELINVEKDYMAYNELGLIGEDKKTFANLLRITEFKEFFLPFEDRVELYKRPDGKIVVGIDLLIEDLKEIRNRSSISDLIENIKSGGSVGGIKRLGQLASDALSLLLFPEVFYLWLFKYIDIPPISHSYDEAIIYGKLIATLKEEEVKRFFDQNKLLHEIELLPERKKCGELKDEDITNIKTCIDAELVYNSDLKKMFPQLYESAEFVEILHQVNKKFNEIKKTPAEGDVEKKAVPSSTPSIKIFLVLEGDHKMHSRNPIRSQLHVNKGITVLFEDRTPLTKKLKVGDIVLGEIVREIPKESEKKAVLL